MDEVKKIGKVEKLPIMQLHVQYIPGLTVYWSPAMGIVESPHVDLMKVLNTYGLDKKRIMETAYFAERQRRRKLGMARWTDKYILDHHIPKRYAILKSIKKRGYDKSQPILVLRKPFWGTRFGYKNKNIYGFEIWTGAGRASAMWALGETKIPVQWVVDKHPGTMKKGKFETKLPGLVWEETSKCT